MMHVREMEGNPNYVLLEPVSVDQNMMASLERQMEANDQGERSVAATPRVQNLGNLEQLDLFQSRIKDRQHLMKPDYPEVTDLT